MAITQFFRWLNVSKPTAQPTEKASFYQSIYPESVRYALQYKGAEMGRAEIRSLLTSWYLEAVYLVVKALVFDRDIQRQFLEDLTRLYYRVDWTVDELKALLEQYITRIPEDMTVTGTKLAQLSRSGNSQLLDEWRNLAENLLAEKPDALPCIIAHTPIYGYHHFIKAYRDSQQTRLYLLMPGWMLNPDETEMGYEITLSNPPTVTLQVKKECLYGTWTCDGVDCKLKQHFCKEAIFIDDTINSGKTVGKLQSFWLSKYGLNMPLDRVRVITNLRKNPSAVKHT
ncbi:MAG: hypothetical protein AAFV98_02600 [Chloroflexota bacterium]